MNAGAYPLLLGAPAAQAAAAGATTTTTTTARTAPAVTPPSPCASAAAGPPLPNRVQVCVRVRPLLPHEVAAGQECVLHRPTPTLLHAMVDPATQAAKQFTFDGVCDQGDGQEAVFEQAGVRGLLNRALEGFNVCILA